MNRSTSNLIKIIAMVTMLIDHIGAILYPEHMFLRVIGRIAFPLFAYLLVEGFRHTSNLNRYLVRLLLFGIISQIPYHFMTPGRINVILYFAVALFSLKWYAQNTKRIYIPLLAGVLTEVLHMSYGIYGIATIYLFYTLRDKKLYLSAGFILLNLYILFAGGSYIQPLSVLALPFLYINIKHAKIKMNKYIAYLFYPVHISILLIIKHLNLL